MRLNNIKIYNTLIALLMLFSLACCTTSNAINQTTLSEEQNDPFEPYNRAATDFNFFLNTYLFRPFDKAYRFIFPETIRTGISNFSDNLKQPYIFVNANF